MCELWEPPKPSSRPASAVSSRRTSILIGRYPVTGGALQLRVSPGTDPVPRMTSVGEVQDGQHGFIPHPPNEPRPSPSLYESPESHSEELPDVEPPAQLLSLPPAREIAFRRHTTMPPRHVSRGPHVMMRRIIMSVSLLLQVIHFHFRDLSFRLLTVTLSLCRSCFNGSGPSPS